MNGRKGYAARYPTATIVRARRMTRSERRSDFVCDVVEGAFMRTESVTQKKIRKRCACEFSFWQLRDKDLNLEPCGYTWPCVSARVDYLITPMGCRALWSVLVWFLTPSLCTVRTTRTIIVRHHFVRLGSGSPTPSRFGFPEFTRFFAIRCRIVLQYRASLHESLRGS